MQSLGRQAQRHTLFLWRFSSVSGSFLKLCETPWDTNLAHYCVKRMGTLKRRFRLPTSSSQRDSETAMRYYAPFGNVPAHYWGGGLCCLRRFVTLYFACNLGLKRMAAETSHKTNSNMNPHQMLLEMQLQCDYIIRKRRNEIWCTFRRLWRRIAIALHLPRSHLQFLVLILMQTNHDQTK